MRDRADSHDKRLQRGLVPEDKAKLVHTFTKTMPKEIGIVAHSCGVSEPRGFKCDHCRIVQDDGRYPEKRPSN